jgi:predicted transcriptional regulator
MSLSSARCKILEALLLNEKPVKAQDIAKEVGIEFKPVNMHLIGLAKAGCATSPAKGMYIITPKGKEALGIPATTKECAQQLLAKTPQEKAFHFYSDLHKPLNQTANGLREFAEKLETVDLASLEFHVCRGDFEKWFTSLGDQELGKKMALLQAKSLTGEILRAKLKDIVSSRCTALSALT